LYIPPQEEEEERLAVDPQEIDSDDLEDDEDDAFMREFRAKRLQGGVYYPVCAT